MINVEEIESFDGSGKIVFPKNLVERKDDWDEELQRRYDKGKFSYKPWIYGW